MGGEIKCLLNEKLFPASYKKPAIVTHLVKSSKNIDWLVLITNSSRISALPCHGQILSNKKEKIHCHLSKTYLVTVLLYNCKTYLVTVLLYNCKTYLVTVLLYNCKTYLITVLLYNCKTITIWQSIEMCICLFVRLYWHIIISYPFFYRFIFHMVLLLELKMERARGQSSLTSLLRLPQLIIRVLKVQFIFLSII